MNDVIERLRDAPTLAFHLQRLQRLFDEEQEQRKHFRDAVSESQKAEFINGEVVVHSPAKHRHTRTVLRLAKLVDTFVELHQLGEVHAEKAMVSLTRNDYEPDVCFFRAETAGAFTPDQMFFPTPDFVCEVLSPSTERVDRVTKYEDYAAHGVTEYWIVDPAAETVEQHLLRGDVYALNVKAKTGTVTSEALPGFTIPVRALFDDAENLVTLQALLTE